MRTIDEVLGRCRVDEITGCWHWRGAMSANLPRIYAPNETGRMFSGPGRRAVWHITNPGVALPSGWRVFATCPTLDCVNPSHSKAGSGQQMGAQIKRMGRLQGDIKRTVRSRLHSRQRSVFTPELIAEIQASSDTGEVWAARLGVSRAAVSRARRGEIVCFQPASGLFSGLLA